MVGWCSPHGNLTRRTVHFLHSAGTHALAAERPTWPPPFTSGCSALPSLQHLRSSVVCHTCRVKYHNSIALATAITHDHGLLYHFHLIVGVSILEPNVAQRTRCQTL